VGNFSKNVDIPNSKFKLVVLDTWLLLHTYYIYGITIVHRPIILYYSLRSIGIMLTVLYNMSSILRIIVIQTDLL